MNKTEISLPLRVFYYSFKFTFKCFATTQGPGHQTRLPRKTAMRAPGNPPGGALNNTIILRVCLVNFLKQKDTIILRVCLVNLLKQKDKKICSNNNTTKTAREGAPPARRTCAWPGRSSRGSPGRRFARSGRGAGSEEYV